MLNLKIVDSDYDLDIGFFWVTFENGESLQCCLISDCKGGYYTRIDSNDCGSNEGISFDCNGWALDESKDFAEINELLFSEAQKIGVEIV